MVKCLGSALDSLASIWEEIGILPEQRSTRTEVVMVHLRNLLDKMVKEEEGLRNKLLSNVKKHTAELQALSDELKVPPNMPHGCLSILQEEKSLRTMVDGLRKEKDRRLAALHSLKDQDQHLCDVLCCTPFYIPSGTVPSEQQLNDLEKHVKEMETEKVRVQIFLTQVQYTCVCVVIVGTTQRNLRKFQVKHCENVGCFGAECRHLVPTRCSL
jgi:protein regulator of cytokinesis 1